ncbi:MAG TPA: response regulator [Methanospirillum sp.]|nr:response regulator [Methanospirillum sp.]
MTGETIMVVEDDGLIALHLMEILESAGYLVLEPIYSGERVIRLLEKSPRPDLILMDVGLAGSLDGIETARQILDQYSIPLIFITAYTSEHTSERMQQVAYCGIIKKPFIQEDLLSSIRKAIKLKGA